MDFDQNCCRPNHQESSVITHSWIHSLLHIGVAILKPLIISHNHTAYRCRSQVQVTSLVLHNGMVWWCNACLFWLVDVDGIAPFTSGVVQCQGEANDQMLSYPYKRNQMSAGPCLGLGGGFETPVTRRSLDVLQTSLPVPPSRMTPFKMAESETMSSKTWVVFRNAVEAFVWFLFPAAVLANAIYAYYAISRAQERKMTLSTMVATSANPASVSIRKKFTLYYCQGTSTWQSSGYSLHEFSREFRETRKELQFDPIHFV